MADTVRLDLAEAISLCEQAAIAAGASEENATALAQSVVAAEAKGIAAVGLTHFLDYLDALEAGRIDGRAEPVITRPSLAVYVSDARGGLAHTGFDRTFIELAKSARLFGVAIFSQRNAFTCGELGYFTGRLAGERLVSFAATNGPALLAGAGGTKPVYCTNPMSFAAPVEGGASSDQLAPERPAASTSTIRAMFAPRLPPKASSVPFIAAAGSVVDRPAESSAQPAGISRPSSAALRMLTKAVALDDWSMTSGAPPSTGAAKDIGLVQ